MAEKTTIARPYAQAMFDIARDKNHVAKIADALQIAAVAVSDPALEAMIGNPELAEEELTGLIIDLCGNKATPEFGNFIKLLAEYKRLDVLPEIAQLFATYRAELESTIEAQVVSASRLSAEQKKEIVTGLKKRLGREVTLQCSVDKNLIGGAIIRAGDLVIDGSVAAQLGKLGQALSR